MSREHYCPLLVLAPYPCEHETDGYLKRVQFIDEQLAGRARVYIQTVSSEVHPIGARQIRSAAGDAVWICYLDPKDDLCRSAITNMIREANLVYVHSVFRVEELGDLLKEAFDVGKVVIDFHGIVPEEFNLEGRIAEVERFSNAENMAMQKAHAAIVVTENMAKHFVTKYPTSKAPLIQIPIFPTACLTYPHDSGPDLEKYQGNSRALRVIYAGGVQKWQNVDRMIHAALLGGPEDEFRFLTPEVQVFKNRLQDARAKIHVEHIRQDGIASHYRWAQYGFILRDQHAVNHVACPTKLTEYLLSNIIPIVLQPEIGDFHQLGYRYLLLDDLIGGRRLTPSEHSEWSAHNYHVAQLIKSRVDSGIKALSAVTQQLAPISENEMSFSFRLNLEWLTLLMENRILKEENSSLNNQILRLRWAVRLRTWLLWPTKLIPRPIRERLNSLIGR